MSLSSVHRQFLGEGLAQWGGPAQCSDAVAALIGYPSAEDFYRDLSRLRAVLDAGSLPGTTDLRRITAAVEIVFVSDELGAGLEWETVTGRSDRESLELLRQVQRIVSRLSVSSTGEGPVHRR